MKFDIPTLALITSIIFAIQTIAIFVQYRVNKTYKGLGWWLSGAILQSIGFFLILTLNIRSIWIMSIFANPLIFGGQILLNVGIMKFLDRKLNRWISISLFVVYIIFYYSFIIINNSIFGRSLVVSISAAVISLIIACAIFHKDNRRFSASANFTASVFFAYGVIQIVMTLVIIILPPLSSYQELYQEPIRIITFIIPLVGSTLWTFGFIIMVNQRLNTENINLLAEKQLILKEVHHRIKNNMSTLYSLLILQAGTLKDSSAIEALKDAGNRVKSMMVLYNKLYETTRFDDVSVKKYLPSLIDEIMENFPNSKLVQIEYKIDDFVLDAKRLQPLGIIFNELLTNIMKYAFSGRDRGLIIVTASQIDNNITLIVEDNGNGMPESVDFENTPGFGLLLVKNLTVQLNGTIRIERENGTRIILDFII
jgi:two-component sensor histidine kinase